MAGAAQGNRPEHDAGRRPSGSILINFDWSVCCHPIHCAFAGVELTPINVYEPGEIERALTEFARNPNSGLIVTGGPQAVTHRDLITTVVARNKLPAVYFRRAMVESGGLISYGPDLLDQYRLAASYVDRILKGEKPADLPVQAPTKYELVINMKTAQALGIDVPPQLLARADEVIE